MESEFQLVMILFKGVTFTQLRFERDLLSWRMDFNWTPFGTNATWDFIESNLVS
jgi:hypothetical protein